MKRFVITCMALSMFAVQSFSQNSKVTSGVISYNNGQYDDALEKLNTALENKGELKEKVLPKLYYYLSQAYLAAGKDSALMEKYPRALLKAYEYYNTTKEVDTKGKYKNQLVLVEQDLWANIFNTGATAYNQDEYSDSQEYFVIASEMQPEDVNSHLMLGYSYWMAKDTMPAIASLGKATEVYAANPPEEPNKDLATAFLIVGTVQNLKGMTRDALKTVSEGREMFPMNGDLQRTELSIYQQNPDLFKEAQAKFEQAMKDNPNDFIIKVAYADLLDKNGQTEKSTALLQDVLNNDPDNLQANIQLGARYVNQAAEINEAKMKMNSEKEIDEANAKVKEKLQSAYPYMKKLHNLQPKEAEWINQLVNIAYYLDEPEEVINEYVKKQQAVMGTGGNE